jgi:dienelactone hydrolase
MPTRLASTPPSNAAFAPQPNCQPTLPTSGSRSVLPAQQLAQTRTGAQACVTLAACADPGQFGTGWPIDEPVQIHGMDHDPYFAGEGDVDNARQLVHDAHHGQLFLYPGDHHLFTDRSLPSYDPVAATQVVSRVLHFPSTY